MKTDLFQSCGHCWVFQICWHIECSTFRASSFRIWNGSTGIPSPPLALFVFLQVLILLPIVKDYNLISAFLYFFTFSKVLSKFSLRQEFYSVSTEFCNWILNQGCYLCNSNVLYQYLFFVSFIYWFLSHAEGIYNAFEIGYLLFLTIFALHIFILFCLKKG